MRVTTVPRKSKWMLGWGGEDIRQQQLTRQLASPLVTMAMYCDIASSLDMPFTLFHASHLARASI
jgi:hypothetical protein